MGTGLGKFKSAGDSFCAGRDNVDKAVEMAAFASCIVSDTIDIGTDSDCAAVDSGISSFLDSGSVSTANGWDSLERDSDSIVFDSSDIKFISNSVVTSGLLEL